MLYPQKTPFMHSRAINSASGEGDNHSPISDDIIELADSYVTLEHHEMVKLAEMFAYWAATDDVTDDQRARLLERAAYFARLANFVGPGWIPLSGKYPLDVLKFLAMNALAEDHAWRNWKGDRSKRAALLLDDLASRMKFLLETSVDPDRLTEQTWLRAERAGIVTADMKVRRLPYAAFVRDLFLDNPRAVDWARRALDWVDVEGEEGEKGEQALLAILR